MIQHIRIIKRNIILLYNNLSDQRLDPNFDNIYCPRCLTTMVPEEGEKTGYNVFECLTCFSKIDIGQQPFTFTVSFPLNTLIISYTYVNNYKVNENPDEYSTCIKTGKDEIILKDFIAEEKLLKMLNFQ